MSAPLPASSDGHPELAVAWVLHGLEPDEDAVFAAHLGDCPGCLRIVAETEARESVASSRAPSVSSMKASTTIKGRGPVGAIIRPSSSKTPGP